MILSRFNSIKPIYTLFLRKRLRNFIFSSVKNFFGNAWISPQFLIWKDHVPGFGKNEPTKTEIGHAQYTTLYIKPTISNCSCLFTWALGGNTWNGFSWCRCSASWQIWIGRACESRRRRLRWFGGFVGSACFWWQVCSWFGSWRWIWASRIN